MFCKRNGIIKANPSEYGERRLLLKREWQSHYDL